uniref:Uncharacterized protein n=1 Tax=Arundo donax TaxID=35708 RepID=A0A0A9AN58_ARUDO
MGMTMYTANGLPALILLATLSAISIGTRLLAPGCL